MKVKLSLCLFLATTTALHADVRLPTGETISRVDFERHVMGLFGKTGCNSGSCHGSFQGKNGFRLSLFGYDPARDYLALTREAMGRRLDRQDVDTSLLLQKATGAMPHEGGIRFNRGSWQHRVIREWINQGATWKPASGLVTEMKLSVPEYVEVAPGKSLQVIVTATFADGTSETITSFCDFRISDDAVATVSPLGLISALRPGDTGLVVSYRGTVRSTRVLVPMPVKPGFRFPDYPANNFIDNEVIAKLRRLNTFPSDLCSDEEFLRRVTIDTLGCLPTPSEVRSFLADQSPNKREKKIDELLKHPLHAALWATKLSDITGNNTDGLEQPNTYKPRRSQQWHEWLQKRIAENVPWDQIVAGILTATSRGERAPEEWIRRVNHLDQQLEKGFATDYPQEPQLDLFWRRQMNTPIEIWGEKVAAAFLGVRLECAQCHKHPTDRWTQSDYWAFANIFSQVSVGISPAAKKVIDEENKARRAKLDPNKNANQQNLILVREVFIADRGRPSANPENGRIPLPKALGGPEFTIKPGQDVRVDLMDWMRAKDNPFFAKAFVNRVWAHYFGVGIVNPVDDFSLANPPTNAKLLDALAQGFIADGYDIRKLERLILTSRTYQLSSIANETNKFDKNNYARSYVRPMMAEMVIDVINSALDTKENFGSDGPSGKNMVEIGASRIQNPLIGYALRIFGRPPRTTACDCERGMEPALPQKLFLMSDDAMQRKLATSPRVIALSRDKQLTDELLCEELFLATLSRKPLPGELSAFKEHAAKESNRQKLVTDAMWALLNTDEFVLNH